MKANKSINKTAIVTSRAVCIGEAVTPKFALKIAQLIIVDFPPNPIRNMVNKNKARAGQAIIVTGSEAGFTYHCCRLIVSPAIID